MEELFDLIVSRDKMTASLSCKKDDEEGPQATVDELYGFLNKRKIVFGIIHENLVQLAAGAVGREGKTIVAEGIPPIHGSDGYLIDQTGSDSLANADTDGEKAIDFRNLHQISSVGAGQVLATIMPPKRGIPGKSIYGAAIAAKNGKPCKLKAGKNVLFHAGQLIASADGQVSFTSTSVNVYPVFEVNGDLDLKTGNIDFIGNVVIRGNVPSGYTLKAGGDIYIDGLVENAVLTSGGSIVIGGGVTGMGHGVLEAGADVQAAYLNQASVKAGADVLVSSSILHSQVLSGGRVVCKKGHIIGGKVEAHKGVETNDIGNLHYTRTLICIGDSQRAADREAEIHREMDILGNSLSKLKVVCHKLNMKKESEEGLSVKEKVIYGKSLSTEKSLQEKIDGLSGELSQLKNSNNDVYLAAKGRIFPNTQISFGKYCKPVPTTLQQTKFFLSDGEILSIPL